MVTRREYNHPDVWSLVAGFIMPAGHPPAWDEEPLFSGGLPDRWMHTSSDPSGLPIAIEWDTDLTSAQELELDRFTRRARRRVADDDDVTIDNLTPVLKAWKNRTVPPTNAQRDMLLDSMVELMRILLVDED